MAATIKSVDFRTKYLSSIWIPFCASKVRDTTLKFLRSPRNKLFLWHAGMEITRHLQSDFECLKLHFYPSGISSTYALIGLGSEAFWIDSIKLQTLTVIQTEPGHPTRQ